MNTIKNMPIIACGLNHKTAPVSTREKVAFPAEKLPLYLHDLVTQENIHEAVILSTCNRSELYCITDHPTQALQWFSRQHQVDIQELKPFMHMYHDQEAIQHIMTVACGLDSMILGESEILGQMKAAYSESCAANAVGPTFNKLFQQVFAVAKEVRTNTAIGACPVSVSSAAIHFAKKSFTGDFEKATFLFLGAGLTIELALRHLKATQQQIIIANRTIKNAELLAEKYQGTAIDFTQLPKALAKADIVIAATGSTLPIVNREMITSRKKPLFIIDIAVPRDVETNVGELPNIVLHTIDDLKPNIQQNVSHREHAADKAREMIKQKSQDFIQWLENMDLVGSTIRAYREKIENLCREELNKATLQLKRGDDPVQVLTSFTYALTNKLLHTPSVQLREAGFAGRVDMLQLVRQLFAIPETAL